MRYLYFLLIAFIFFSCTSSSYRTEKPSHRSQTPDRSENRLEEKKATPEQMQHQFIKEYGDLTKDVIFERAIKWIAMNFKSAKQVIDYQDKEAGTIIAKGIIPDITTTYGNAYERIIRLSFTLTLDAKDGKARFDYTNVKPIMKNTDEEVIALTDTEAFQLKAQDVLNGLTENISTAIMTKDDF